MVTDIQGQPLLTDIVDCPEMAISATQIRQWLQQGRDTRYVLPDAVRDYIAWNGLYR
jgi:nicotinate-nucleotide adenylyltransferase